MSIKQNKIIWPLLCVITIVTTAIGFVIRSARSGLSKDYAMNSAVSRASDLPASPMTPAAVDVSASPQGLSLFGAAEIVRFTVYDAGIRPSVSRTTRGLVEIHMEDRSEQSAGLVVQRESGPVLSQVLRSVNRWRGSLRMRLEPGRYRVFDATRPGNSATLIVQP